MAIDPVAVSGGAAAKLPTGTDVAAQSSNAGDHGANFENSALKAGERVDLFDYANQQKSRNGLSLDALDADGKSRYLANPSTLGEKVLNYMEKFHNHLDVNRDMWKDGSALRSSTALAGNNSVSGGPASLVPDQASALSTQPGSQDKGADVFDQFAQIRELAELSSLRKAETTLVSGIAQQFSKSMGTLLRGQ